MHGFSTLMEILGVRRGRLRAVFDNSLMTGIIKWSVKMSENPSRHLAARNLRFPTAGLRFQNRDYARTLRHTG